MPKPYLVIKETLVREYARRGGKLRRREARELVKLDVNKVSRVWDFLVQAGYLQLGSAAMVAAAAAAAGGELALGRRTKVRVAVLLQVQLADPLAMQSMSASLHNARDQLTIWL